LALEMHGYGACFKLLLKGTKRARETRDRKKKILLLKGKDGP